MQFDWLILADAAQVNGNKLYLLGGGWDRITVNTPFPAQHRCAIAAAIKVAWIETNQKHDFEIEVMTSDGESLAKVQGQFEAGRPAGVLQGADQRFQLAADMVLGLPRAGEYVIIARINGQEMSRYPFQVVEAARR